MLEFRRSEFYEDDEFNDWVEDRQFCLAMGWTPEQLPYIENMNDKERMAWLTAYKTIHGDRT